MVWASRRARAPGGNRIQDGNGYTRPESLPCGPDELCQAGTDLDRAEGKPEPDLIEWADKWKKRAEERRREVEERFEGDPTKQADALASHPADEWFQWILVTAHREKLRRALVGYRFFQPLADLEGLNEAQIDELAAAEVEKVKAHLEDPATLIERIKAAHAARNYRDAIESYLRFRRLKPDFNELDAMDDIKETELDPVLEDIRQRALEWLGLKPPTPQP